MKGNYTPDEFKGDVAALLSQHGISPTQQRRQIARILLTRTQHLSAEQILERVNRESNIVSKATVYNTLGLFARKGLIREVIVDSNKVFYDSNVRPHHHFYNVDTGTLQDIDAQEVTLHATPIPPEGTQMDGVDIIIRIKSNPVI